MTSNKVNVKFKALIKPIKASKLLQAKYIEKIKNVK